MKTHSPRRSRAFSLLEVLIAVAIVVILMASGLGIAFMLIDKAKKANALAVCVELSQAIENYQTDSNIFPVDVTEDTVISSNSPEGVALLKVLLGEETVEEPRNSSGRNYLNVQTGANNIDGLIRNDAQEVTGLYDPWGGDYKIMLDGDFDGSLIVLPKGASSGKKLKRSAVVWTDGRDGVDNTGETKDDVKSW